MPHYRVYEARPVPSKKKHRIYFTTMDDGYYTSLLEVEKFYRKNAHNTELVIRSLLPNLKDEFIIATHSFKGSLITGKLTKINKKTVVINSKRYLLDNIMIYHPSIIAACSLYV